MNYDYLYRIVLFGDSAVGKTSFMNKYIKNDDIQNYLPTIGVDFGAKLIKYNNHKIIKVHLWDTSGNNNFRNIVRSYYGGVAGAVLIYDKSNYKSFQNLPNWISDFDSVNKHNDLPIIVIGTKTDLPSAVPEEEIKTFVHKYNVLYNEVNLNTKDEIPDVLVPLWDKIWKQYIISDNVCVGIKKRTINSELPESPPPKNKSSKSSIIKNIDHFQSKCIIS